jgi:hypothetical protein
MDKSFSGQLSVIGSNSKYYLILFLLWPFLAFLLALKNYSQKEAKKVVYIFLIYYGLNFVISSQGVDAARYALELKTTASLPFSDFFKIVGGLYNEDDSVDIYEPLVSFIVSRFTSNHRVLFAVFAAIFGFFYLKSISLLYNLYRKNHGWNTLIHLIFFIIIIPITSINGVRMWTAAWIFFYGAIHVVLYRDTRYLLIAFASSFVHWSFLSANVILVIYYFAGNRNVIYFLIALVSFVLPQLIVPFLQTVSLRLGGSLQNRYEGYSSEGYILEIQGAREQVVWFVKIYNDLVFYYILLALIVILIGSRNIMKDKKEENLFSFLLLFLAFVNFGKPIPSFGNRFQIVFFLFATLYVFLYFLKTQSNKISLLNWIGLLPMLLYAAVTFRIGSDSISAWIFTPGLGLPLLVPGLSIADLLFY